MKKDCDKHAPVIKALDVLLTYSASARSEFRIIKY